MLLLAISLYFGGERLLDSHLIQLKKRKGGVYRASMEQVRSMRARYVKREAREGDDGMGLKYPPKQLGTRQMRIGLPLTRFLMKRHRKRNLSNTLSRMKIV